MHEIPTILLVEDNTQDVALVRDMLDACGDSQYSFEHERQLGDGLRRIGRGGIDLLLLDLALPDTRGGIDTVTRAQTLCEGKVPIIVFTGNEDQSLATKSLQAGVQDYLMKGRFNADSVQRAIRYALERHRLLMEEKARNEQHEQELRQLRELAAPRSTYVTAQSYGQGPLNVQRPEAFDRFVDDYSTILDHALETSAYRVNNDITEALRALAERLGFLHAGARDVVAIHTEALKYRIARCLPPKARAYAGEGRLMVLELMGNLVTYYRTFADGYQPPTERRQ